MNTLLDRLSNNFEYRTFRARVYAINIVNRMTRPLGDAIASVVHACCPIGVDSDVTGAALHRSYVVRTLLQAASALRVPVHNLDLRNADLRGCHLKRLKLIRATLVGCDFTGANLDFATLKDADLRDTNFTSAQLFGADLSYSNLSCAKFSFANLNYVAFAESILSYAALDHCTLEVACLHGADLRNANLRHSRFTNARFGDRFLMFESMDIRGADLSSAHVPIAALEVAITDPNTQLPCLPPGEQRYPHVDTEPPITDIFEWLDMLEAEGN